MKDQLSKNALSVSSMSLYGYRTAHDLQVQFTTCCSNRCVRLRNTLHWTPNDVIGAVFRYTGLREIPSDTRLIQEGFYDLEKSFPDLFKFLAFRTDGLFPYSKRLARILSELKNARLLRVRNPDYDVIELMPQAVDYIDRSIIPKFSTKDRALLRKSGRAFAHYWAQHSRPTNILYVEPAAAQLRSRLVS